MNIAEIASGTLANPNVPEFTKPVHVCDMDGFSVMQDEWRGFTVFGILTPEQTPMTYIITQQTSIKGLYKFQEIHTLPKFSKQNLGAILLYSLKAKLGISLLLAKDEIVSNDARKLFLKMAHNNRLTTKTASGEKINVQQLTQIFNTIGDTDDELILESRISNQPKFNKDLILSGRWYIRGSAEEEYD